MKKKLFVSLTILAFGLLGPVAQAEKAAGLLSKGELRAFLRKTEKIGKRPTGSPNHNYFLDYVAQSLSRKGVSVSRDTWTFNRWYVPEEDEHMRKRIASNFTMRQWTANESNKVKLEVLDEKGRVTTELPVAAYQPYSGVTPPGGITSEISINPFKVRNRIFVQGYRDSLPKKSAVSDITQRRSHYLYDPNKAFASSHQKDRSLMNKAFPLWLKHRTLHSQKALGLITIFEDYPFNWLQEAHVPHIASGVGKVPGLLIDRGTRNRFRDAMLNGGKKVRLTLEAAYDANAKGYTLVATVPGQSDEVILLNAESDGMTAYQATGTAIVMGMMQHIASRPIAERPRTVKAVFSTHYTGSKAAADWVRRNRNLKSKIVAYLGVEAVGGTRWVQDNSGKFYKAGDSQPTWTYVSGGKNSTLTKLMKDMIQQQRLHPHTLINDETVFSEATVFHAELKIPIISTLSTPAYNLSATLPVVDKINIDELYRMQVGYTNLLEQVMYTPAEQLK